MSEHRDGHQTRPPLPIVGGALSVVDIEQVARHERPITLAQGAIERLRQSRKFLESAMEDGRPIYGVNTGFGSFSSTAIEPDKLGQVKRNLIRVAGHIAEASYEQSDEYEQLLDEAESKIFDLGQAKAT